MASYFWHLLWTTAALIGAPAGAARPAPTTTTVRVDGGALRATIGAGNMLAFKGIPYAAPPAGRLRWRSPAPVRAWKGVRDASAFGPRCLAPTEGPLASTAPSAEDCLTANVWTGYPFAKAKRPVMVWIHGGGFQFGSSQDANFDGARLAAKGVVVVSFNYRLGVLGFLAHPDLDREGSASGNFGLQDQLQALRWVRANVARFGGDPTQVTLFGESAGAMSVGMLMSSPLARGLFSKAIGQSGAFWDSEHGSLSTRAEAQARGRALAERLGPGSIEALRGLPGQQLVSATQWNPRADPVIASFSPSIDGFVLPSSPAAVFLRGEQMKIPLIAGHNGAEDFIFRSRASPHASAGEFREAASRLFGSERLPDFLRVYPASTDREAEASAFALIGDLAISQQSWAWLQMQQRAGVPRVYGYEFRYRSPYAPMPIHGADVDFVFGTLTPQRLAPPGTVPDARDREVAEQMMSYWVNFARTGDPNGPGLPLWPAYASGAPQVMEFAEKTSARVESDTSRFRFIESFRSMGRLPEHWRSTGRSTTAKVE